MLVIFIISFLIFSLPTSLADERTSYANSVCEDMNPSCHIWASAGECDNNPEYMLEQCRGSCAVCNFPTGNDFKCEDKDRYCHLWASRGECHSNPRFMLNECPASCAVCEPHVCRDRYEICFTWAIEGECLKNIDWMTANCRASCGRCGETVCRDSLPMCQTWSTHGECENNALWMKTNCKLSCAECIDNLTKISDEDVDTFWCLYNLEIEQCKELYEKRGLPAGPTILDMYYKTARSQYNDVPNMIYGTAWKKGNTALLVIQAIHNGFRGIDTACQPKHYHEPGVGEALEYLFRYDKVGREQLFIQTKYTPISSQHQNHVPYNFTAPISSQIHQSIELSLKNLKIDYLDSVLLHTPLDTIEETMEAWFEMEEFVKIGKVKYLGISNCYELKTLAKIYALSNIKPFFLQNRFYKDTNYDEEIRKFCNYKNILYQSFWTLTANKNILQSAAILEMSERLNKTPEQIFLKFILTEGIIPLIGTTQVSHMQEDQSITNFAFNVGDINTIRSLF